MVSSSSGWYRDVYSWDSCSGGSDLQMQFLSNCHWKTTQWIVDPDGFMHSPSTIWDSGVGCTVSGNLQFQQNGSVAIWTSFGNKIWFSPTGTTGDYLWEMRYLNNDHLMQQRDAGHWFLIKRYAFS